MPGREKLLWVPTWLLVALSLCAQAQPSPGIEQLKEDAAKAQSAGNAERAISLYATVLAKAPTWTDGWWEYGKLLYDARRFRAAANAFGRLTRLAPENPLGFALLGLCEYEQKDWNNSAFHLNKALAGGKGMPSAITQSAAYHLALALMRQGNGDGARVTLGTLFHQAPDYPGLPLALGSAELNLQEVPPAGATLFPAAQLAGEAAVAALQERKKDAEQSLQKLLTQFPDQPSAHLNYGLLLESEHRDEEAVSQFLAETKTNPGSPAPWLWLGRLALDREDPAAAREYALKARTLDPGDGLSYLIEGRSFMGEKRWDDAVAPLREAEKRAPLSSEVHYALASVYAALHRPGEAEEQRQLFLKTTKSGAEQ
jgi:tetratricopeptide (TPR) repeat protein